jgi:hypothetical protein
VIMSPSSYGDDEDGLMITRAGERWVRLGDVR